MTKYFVDSNGNYIGGFDGTPPPAGSVEVPTPPDHGLDKFVSGAWVAHDSAPTVSERRAVIDEYLDGNEALAFIAIAVAEGAKTKSEIKTAAKAKVL